MSQFLRDFLPTLSNFDVIYFLRLGLINTLTIILTVDINLNNNGVPFRNDRDNDAHGGVAVYV